MKSGEFIYAKTHAEFLNKSFGTNYKSWMKCVWNYSDDLIVWMVRFDKNINGWRNTFVSDSRIKEENLDNVAIWDGKTVETAMEIHKNRLVIEIIDLSHIRKYVFRGRFIYDRENSNPRTVRFYDKIDDQF